jgi:two-component system sensor histidine kinase HydH
MRERTILCVDDNVAFTDNLREILGDAGYAVRLAASCQEAVTVAAQGFDVALVDVRLPDGQGTELAPRLLAINPDAQVILLTGFATLESAVDAVRAGAWAYLLKPCAPPELLLAVEQAVRQIAHIEHKRELERRTQVAEKLAAVGTMTAGLSHEIKNPLNAAGLQLEVLARRISRLPAELHAPLIEPLGLVQHEITRLNALLEEFLRFATVRELRLERVELAAVLRRLVDLLAAQADAAGVRLDGQIGDDLVLMGEPSGLEQVFMNLIINGIQATPPDGVVRLRARNDHDRLEISVEDSGPGIPAELEARIFEPFFTTKAQGSGLGLPLAHRIVSQHGGQLTFGRAPSGGARFVVTLPAGQVERS